MSRVGKLPVIIPDGVKIGIGQGEIAVEGPKGKLSRDLIPDIDLTIEGKKIITKRKRETKKCRALHGLCRSLINNMVIGVSEGFSKELVITGVGYRAEVKGESLILNLGYSNPIEYPIPADISVEVEANNQIRIKGIDKEQLGQVCAEIRSFRPPEPYKGKGIRYRDETIRRKIGKSGIK